MVPYRVMETAKEGFEVVKAMAESGNPGSITDAGVGAMALRTCIGGAFLNVKINAVQLEDKTFSENIISKASAIESDAIREEELISELVNSRIK
jgi:glutamate formiminotransferase/formiminotetrahydrofolate cyclodeaminase